MKFSRMWRGCRFSGERRALKFIFGMLLHSENHPAGERKIGMVNLVWSQGRTGFSDAAAIRRKVFVEEQGFEDEFDENDDSALHLTLYLDGRAAATLRMLPEREGTVYHIGRVAVLRSCRGKRLGTAIMREAISKASSVGALRLELGAQKHAEPFYRRLGFIPYGEFEEQGCPHVHMALDLTPGCETEDTHVF